MGAAALARLLLAAIVTMDCELVSAYPERGKFGLSDLTNLTNVISDCSGHSDGRIKYGFEKTMFKGTTVTAAVSCSPDSPASISVGMYLVHSICYNEQLLICLMDVVNAPLATSLADMVRSSRDTEGNKDNKGDIGSNLKSDQAAEAAAAAVAQPDGSTTPPRTCSCRSSDGNEGKAALPEPRLLSFTSVSLSCSKVVAADAKPSGSSREHHTATVGQPKAGEQAANVEKDTTDKRLQALPTINERKALPTTKRTAKASILAKSATLTATAPADGVYFVLLQAVSRSADYSNMNFTVDSAEAKSSYGYLSAVDWPNYYFYMIMAVVYIIFQIAWFVMLACNWRDLLRIQYYIGAVIVLGMIEKAVLFAEYENINKSGVSIKGAVIFVQIVSNLKRASFRVLIILICLGYGTVQPSLGSKLQKVLAAGIVYFLVASIEGCIRIQRDDYDSNGDLGAAVMLIVVEVGIYWWIFTSLVRTYRTLRLHCNVKFSTYQHFVRALIFSVLASLAFISWFLYAVRFSACMSVYRELWLEEGFWQMLSTLFLLIVIILWCPSANDQSWSEASDPGQRQADESQCKEYMAEDVVKRIEKTISTKGLVPKS